MFENSRYEYSVKVCPSNEPENLEILLNQMSEDGWELYMLHEVDSGSKGLQYNCIFYREYEEEDIAENSEIVEVNDFKSRMEKMLHPSDEPYKECLEIQRKINQKQQDITKIKKQLDSSSKKIDHKKLNEKISKYLKELNELKNNLNEVIDSDRMYNRINLDKLTIVVSEELLSIIDNEKNGELISETVKLRQKLTDNLGYVIPTIRFTNSETLDANEYRIYVRGINSLTGIAYPGYIRYFEGEANLTKKPKGAIEDVDPITGEKVFWIEESTTKNFWEKGMNIAQVIASHLEFIVCRYVDEILDYSDVNRYIEIAGSQNTSLISNLIPESMSIGDIRYIFANLIREKISVKDVIFIFERLNDFSQLALEKEAILEKLRVAMSRQICSRIANEDGTIYGIEISDDFAESLEQLLMQGEDNFYFSPKNPKIMTFIKKVSNVIKNSEYDTSNIAIISHPDIRMEVFALFEQIIPNLAVISKYEIASGINLEIIETIN